METESVKKNRLFLGLGGFFVTNALVAEFIGTKIFSLEKTIGIDPVQWNVFGHPLNFDLTAGVLLWPVVFVMTDIINEYYGKKGVRRLSYLTAGLLVYSFIMIRLAMNLSPNSWWEKESQSALGLSNMNMAFNAVFGQGLMIILGSLVAFLVGQIVDATLFKWLKKRTGSKGIWIRATGSTLISQLIDSYVVLFIAFYFGSDWSAERVLAIGTMNYFYKLLVALVMIPILYAVHYLIDLYLGKSLAEKMMQEAVEE